MHNTAWNFNEMMELKWEEEVESNNIKISNFYLQSVVENFSITSRESKIDLFFEHFVLFAIFNFKIRYRH